MSCGPGRAQDSGLGQRPGSWKGVWAVERGDEALKGAIRRLASSAPDREGAGEVRSLACRLDDRGCAYGRVTNARLEEVARGYERVEAKLNAVLLAATGTFLSTLVGMAIYHLRGG
ncbi:MAG: hypothetical protein ACM3US_06060 [Sphingomonadaceae bacterium]